MTYLDGLLARDEVIRIQAHRHILFLLGRTLLYVLATVGLVVVAVIVAQQDFPGKNLIALAVLVAALIPFGIAAYRFIAWRLEEYVVTNYRIIQVEGIFSKRTFDTALEKVNDVQMTQSVFGRMFGFGNIEIITGSEIGVNHLTAISDPFAFKRGLLESKMNLDGFNGAARQGNNGQDAARLLAALTELRDSGVISHEEYDDRKHQLLQR